MRRKNEEKDEEKKKKMRKIGGIFVSQIKIRGFFSFEHFLQLCERERHRDSKRVGERVGN